MAVTLSAAVIAQIIAGGDNPRTSDEWIIAALNLGGILATGDIKSDGSVPFAGQEIFNAGLKTNLITDNGAPLLINQTFAGGLMDITTLDAPLTIFSGDNLILRTANNGSLDITIHGTGTVVMNGAPTYTGTLAGAAGLNVVNGLIIA